MKLFQFARHLLGALAITALVVSPACKKSTPEEKEIQELQKKAAELDKKSQQLSVTGADQAKKLKEAGLDMRPGTETMQFTEEQKKALEERVKAEKNTSYQALLQEVLDKDKEIKDLNDKIAQLRVALPKPDMAKSNDSHYGLALRFLKKQGVSENEARRLVSRVNLMEKLAPGFEVYHFYSNGAYGTWVSQGKASITPNDLIREEREKIEGERDTAVAQNEKLEEEVSDLVAEKARISSEIEGLRTEKTKLIEEMNALTATNETQKAKLNSMHYVVGDRKKLEKDGVIVVPIFAKDRAGANWADSVFNQSIDLRSADTITIKAEDLGLKKIGKVSVVPGSIQKETHYSLTLSEDKMSATVKILVKERFKNEKIVFAVAD